MEEEKAKPKPISVRVDEKINLNKINIGNRADEKSAFFDIILGNCRGLNTTDQAKAIEKKKVLLAGFSAIAPECKSSAKIKVMTETKAGRQKLKDFLHKSCEVQTSSNSKIDSGGTAIVTPFDQKNRPYLTNLHAKSKDITAVKVESRAHKQPGSLICAAVYINPGSTESAKKDRELAIAELESALKLLFINFKNPPIAVLGDFNQIGMKKLEKMLKDYGLISIFDKQATHEGGNQLDGLFTNIKCIAKQMVPIEGMVGVTDHKLLTCRLELESRDLIMKVKKASQS